MKDKSRCHACANGNDGASSPVRNNAKGENHQRGQQGNFDQGFHRGNYAPALARFPAPGCATLGLLIGPVAATKKPRDRPPGLRCFASKRKDQYRATTGPPNR